MKKLKFIIPIFVVALSFVFISSLAKAETREFIFPIISEPTNLFEKAIQSLDIDVLGVRAAQISRDGGQIGDDGDDATYAEGMIRVTDGGGGADDGHFYLDFPTENVYSSPEPIKFRDRDCVFTKDFDNCFAPETAKKTVIYPWQVFKAELVTIKTDANESNNCKTNVLIVKPGTSCQFAMSDGTNVYSSNDGLCSIDNNLVTLIEGSDKPAGRVCGHVRVDGGGWLSTKYWQGFLKGMAKSPEFDNFGIRGKDADSGQVKTATAGQILNICKGESVDLFWDTKDVLETSIVYGDVDPATCGGCSAGQAVKVNFSGQKTVKPNNSTSFSLIVRGATGDGVLNLSPDPVSVSLKDCAPVEAPIDHCDQSENINELGENPYCLARYDTPEYGSTKKCCHWPENPGEFGDGCGKCGGGAVPTPFGAPSVDLVINGKDDPVIINSGDSVDLSWVNKLTSAISCTASDGWSGTQVPNGFKTINNITEDTEFSLTCSNSFGESKDTVEARVQAGGVIPIQLTATLSTTGINLDWTDNFDNETGFEIYRSIGNCSSLSYLATRPTNTTKLELKGLDPDTLYCHRIVAINSGGDLGQSNDASATTLSEGEAPAPPPPSAKKGNIRVKIRLNGNIVSGDVDYKITGPQSLTGTDNQSFNSVKVGNYIITHLGGLPEGGEEDAVVFQSYSPARSLFVSSNKTIDFYLDFGTLATCDLRVEAQCDGSAWTGPLAYALVGPITLNGTAASQNFSQIPSGDYYLSDMMSGPGTLESISPSNPAFCTAGGETTLQMNFTNCGGSVVGSTRYSCNLQSGRCQVCVGDNVECPYNNLNFCQADCSGGGCSATAQTTCWTNYDSEACIGLIDQDSASPNVVLTNHSTGCSNVQSCKWEVNGFPQYTQDSCAPFPWYDDPGTYVAKLTVLDVNGISTVDSQEFTVRDIDGVACDFAWSPENPTMGSKVDFFDRSLVKQGEEITSWQWTFSGADLATSTNSIVQDVVFGSVGEKTVNLKATTNGGYTCSLSKKVNIRKVNPKWWEVVPD